MSTAAADLQIGRDALERGAWTEAREAFERSVAEQESPEALEGLGVAAWWLDLADVVFDVRERAYRLYQDRKDAVSAARVAIWMGWDYWAFRGEDAVANGWLQRARRLLEGHGQVPELAWLELREGALALFEHGDPDQAFRHAAAGIAVAQVLGSIDLEMLGRSVQGLALVTSGAVAEGMRTLDEVNAAVVAGELHDLIAIGLACCYLIAACDRVRDYDRAMQWCTRLKAFCAKWGLKPLFAVCRTQYASICMWRGTWIEAEEELTAATDELAASRPAMTSDGLVRLAELRRRQGRLVEAAEMFEQSEPHSLALLGRAEIALDRDDPQAAAELAARYMRRVMPHNRTARAAGLELLVRALVRTRDMDGARTALTELTNIATLVETLPHKASASYAAGFVATGAGDLNGAQRHFEDAVDLYLQSGAPFEVSRARIELARTLASRGRVDAARDEARRAMELLGELKAEIEIVRAKSLLDSLRSQAATAADSPLSTRETEVLKLVAAGLNNQTIAEQLFVSEHTVHRHVANILNKLSVSSRAAAVAQAARRGLLG
jgi:LuxR family maltose regulon positive regulatory protein